MKNLRSRQVCWAQKLPKYHFRIDYCKSKANGAVDALSHFSQKNEVEEKKLWAENTRIFYYLKSSLTNATLLGPAILASLSPLHQLLICITPALPQLRRFWNMLRTELNMEGPYLANNDSIRLWLQELQETNSKAQNLRQQGRKSCKKVNEMLHHQSLPFVPKAIWIELISYHHNNSLADYFAIKKTCKLLA